MNKLLILSLILVKASLINAQKPIQQLVSSAGDSHYNQSYQMDWSVGEIAIKTLNESSFAINQGFHQVQIDISTLINNTDSKIMLKLFPNPTSSIINLTTNTNYNQLNINIKTLAGTIIHNESVHKNTWRFDLTNYPTGVYIIQVNNKKRILKSFKVIKN
jgi:hypothetical protein